MKRKISGRVYALVFLTFVVVGYIFGMYTNADGQRVEYRETATYSELEARSAVSIANSLNDLKNSFRYTPIRVNNVDVVVIDQYTSAVYLVTCNGVEKKGVLR